MICYCWFDCFMFPFAAVPSRALQNTATQRGRRGRRRPRPTTHPSTGAGVRERGADYSASPLQQAILQDLRLLLDDFEERHRTLRTAERCSSPNPPSALKNPSSSHTPVGTFFATFAHAFRDAKAALLHTRYAPSSGSGAHGIDQASYAQLLYDACWSLLSDAVRTWEDLPSAAAATAISTVTTTEADPAPTTTIEDPFLLRATCAVFCLYALFETNPLPHTVPSPEGRNGGSTNDPGNDGEDGHERRSVLSLLSHGVASTRNANRRAFRNPIRVDLEHYTELLRLQDRALRHRATCEAARCEAEHHRYVSFQAASLPEEDAWECVCGAASDVLLVIRRLKPCFDHCAYTGPCGLEAMALHREYSYQSSTNRREAPADESPLPRVRAVPFVQLENPDLEVHLQQYLRDCASIRFPPPLTNLPTVWQSRLRRVRNGLDSIFESSAGNPPSPSSSRQPRVMHWFRPAAVAPTTSPRMVRLKPFHVTFDVPATRTVATGTASHDTERNGNDRPAAESVHFLAHNDADAGPSDDVCEVAVPGGLSEVQQRSVQAALESLASRGDGLIRRLMSAAPESDHGGNALTKADDVSTLGVSTNGVRFASSVASSNVGRLALQKLLLSAGQQSTLDTTLARDSEADTFLGAAPDVSKPLRSRRKAREPAPTDDHHNLSDLSSDEDALSVAASTVGRKALLDLLAQSGGAPSNRGRQHQQKRRRITSAKKSMREHNGSGDSNSEAEEASTNASTRGGCALNFLLSVSQPGAAVDAEERDLPGTGTESATDDLASNPRRRRSTRRVNRSLATRKPPSPTSRVDDSSSCDSDTDGGSDDGCGHAALRQLLSRI